MDIVKRKAKVAPQWLDRLPDFIADFVEDKLMEQEEESLSDSVTYASLLSRMTDMMIQNNTVLMSQLIHCDILAQMPMNQYPTFAFDKTAEIIEQGRTLMRKAIDEYESSLCLHN